MPGSRQSEATVEDAADADVADVADVAAAAAAAAEGDGYSCSSTRGQFLSGSTLPYRALAF